MCAPSSFSHSFRQRDRIGVVGPNGVGKSTFLKVLTGSLELAAGSVRLGDTVRIGYYEQVRREGRICYPSLSPPLHLLIHRDKFLHSAEQGFSAYLLDSELS